MTAKKQKKGRRLISCIIVNYMLNLQVNPANCLMSNLNTNLFGAIHMSIVVTQNRLKFGESGLLN